MQLIRIKLLSDFRSLKKNFEMNFSQEAVPNEEQLINPICLVGKNGTGKSNTLQVFCEIFFYLESLLLDYPSKIIQLPKSFGFELEYKFQIEYQDEFIQWSDPKFIWDDYRHVRIIKKPKNEEPSYNLIDKNGNSLNVKRAQDTIRELKEKIKSLLPKKVIGYSSGLNELISNPFLKMQFHYFHEYQQRLQEDVLDGFEDGKLLYMNYESNAAVVVSNFLLQDKEKLKILDDTLECAGLDSFRICIEMGNTVEIDPDARSNESTADLTDFFKRQINDLKKCSSTFYERDFADPLTSEIKTLLVLDFKVDFATKAAFSHYFGNTYALYSLFHKLNLLNIAKISSEKRDIVRNAVSGTNISDVLPKLSSDQLLFRIENVRLLKSDLKTTINYKNISDGEHQFMHIIGTSMIMNEPRSLFILDEPETHFNPKWRSKLINTLNKIEKAEIEIQKRNNIIRVNKGVEIMLTTHSPFIISDSYRTKVWKFNKINNKLVYDLIPVRTYGTSFSVLLDEAFDKSETVSEMSGAYIGTLRKNIENIDLDNDSLEMIKSLQTKVLELGESVEKFELYSYLNALTKINKPS